MSFFDEELADLDLEPGMADDLEEEADLAELKEAKVKLDKDRAGRILPPNMGWLDGHDYAAKELERGSYSVRWDKAMAIMRTWTYAFREDIDDPHLKPVCLVREDLPEMDLEAWEALVMARWQDYAKGSAVEEDTPSDTQLAFPIQPWRTAERALLDWGSLTPILDQGTKVDPTLLKALANLDLDYDDLTLWTDALKPSDFPRRTRFLMEHRKSESSIWYIGLRLSPAGMGATRRPLARGLAIDGTTWPVSDPSEDSRGGIGTGCVPQEDLEFVIRKVLEAEKRRRGQGQQTALFDLGDF